MSWFNIVRGAKPMLRDLGNGRVLEYLNLGNGVTKSRILLGGKELLTRTARVNSKTGERFISTVERLGMDGKVMETPTRYFTHVKKSNIFDESGKLVRRNSLVERGVADVSLKGGYCRTSDISLISQNSNGYVSEIKCTQPNFEYTRNLDTSPTIFNWT